jgi:hypothetical protein
MSHVGSTDLRSRLLLAKLTWLCLKCVTLSYFRLFVTESDEEQNRGVRVIV